MKKVVFLFVVGMLCASLSAVIYSTPGGGYWNNPATWEGAIIPGPVDDVVVQGPVIVTVGSICLDLTVTTPGSLYNSTSDAMTLTVNGNLDNAGIIRDDYSWNYLKVICKGDFSNTGAFSARDLFLSGSVDQSFYSPGSLGPDNLVDDCLDSDLILTSDISLANTAVNLNGAALILNGRALSVSGGYLAAASVIGGGGSVLSMGNNCYLNYVTIDDIILQGEVQIFHNVVIGNLVNYATVFNKQDDFLTLTVTGNLTNYGTLRNHPSWNAMFVDLGGDLYDYGTISNSKLTLTGDAMHQIYQAPETAPISCATVESPSAIAICQLLSDLRFVNSTLHFHSGFIYMYSGEAGLGISLNGGSLQFAQLYGNAESNLHLVNGAFLNNVSANSLQLYGTVYIADSVSIGDLVNYATVYNYQDNSYTLSVSERLENRGSILNNPSWNALFVNLSGNFYDYGVLGCNRLTFYGDSAILLYQSAEAGAISCVTFESASVGSTYHMQSDLRFSNCDINLNNRHLAMYVGDAGYGLAASGGCLRNCVISGNGTNSVTMSNNAYLTGVSADNLILHGTVFVSDGVTIGDLVNYATVYNYSDNFHILSVTQYLYNFGSMLNHPSWNHLEVFLSGNLYDCGAISVYRFRFDGSGYCSLYQSPGSSDINCAIFESTSSAASYQLLSSLRFTNCGIDFNSQDIILYQYDNAYGLTVSGGYLKNAHLVGAPGSYLTMGGNAHLRDSTADQIVFNGTVQVAGNVVIGRLVNNGTVYNYADNVWILTVDQRLENRGAIFNHPSWNALYLALNGDLYNYGTISNNKITFGGGSLHNLFQGEAAADLHCAFFNVLPESGNFQLRSDLGFDYCSINFGGKNVAMHLERSCYSLNVQGGYLTNATLETQGFSTLEMSENAYLDNIAAGDLILRGTVNVRSAVTFNDVVVYGTVYNYADNWYNMVCNGNLVNYGVIRSHPSWNYMVLHCRGDLANYGTIQCYQTFIDGVVNQYLLIDPGCAISCPGGFYLESDVGAALWFLNGIQQTLSAVLDLGVNPYAQQGVWQPFSGENYGRYVTIGSGLAVTTPENLVIYRSGPELKLRWDQVANAVSYNIYAAADPYGNYTFLDKAFDYDLTDGIVWWEFRPAESCKFFKVTAGN